MTATVINGATVVLIQALALLSLVTIISGAQIGTSPTGISVIQIDSMALKRTTWITEETLEGQKETLKTIRGSAIISDRYANEARNIAYGLSRPYNIEQETISAIEEKELINNKSTVNLSEIQPPSIKGYNEQEKEAITKIIADISLVFWIKEDNELSRVLISPQLDWKVTSDYKDISGE